MTVSYKIKKERLLAWMTIILCVVVVELVIWAPGIFYHDWLAIPIFVHAVLIVIGVLTAALAFTDDAVRTLLNTRQSKTKAEELKP